MKDARGVGAPAVTGRMTSCPFQRKVTELRVSIYGPVHEFTHAKPRRTYVYGRIDPFC